VTSPPRSGVDTCQPAVADASQPSDSGGTGGQDLPRLQRRQERPRRQERSQRRRHLRLMRRRQGLSPPPPDRLRRLWNQEEQDLL
jgi:hypothetical protein